MVVLFLHRTANFTVIIRLHDLASFLYLFVFCLFVFFFFKHCKAFCLPLTRDSLIVELFGSVRNSVLKSLRVHLFSEVAGGCGHYRQQNKARCQLEASDQRGKILQWRMKHGASHSRLQGEEVYNILISQIWPEGDDSFSLTAVQKIVRRDGVFKFMAFGRCSYPERLTE